MSDTRFRLVNILLERGADELAHHLKLSESEISRKVNSQAGFTLTQIAAALDFVGAQIVSKNDAVISNDELFSLRTFARKALKE